jgi:hypothetical protein
MRDRLQRYERMTTGQQTRPFAATRLPSYAPLGPHRRDTRSRTLHLDGREDPAVDDDPNGSLSLRHAAGDRPGITRQRSGRGFSYRDTDGHPIRDPEALDRIRSIAIPPAWTDVWICPLPNGHLQATGRDARGRKQYRYHPRYRARRSGAKFERLIAFARALPAIRDQVERDLGRSGLPREKVLAAVVRLLELTLIRVGNDEYARLNRSFGLTTLRDRHASIDGSAVTFRFRGKSGQQQEVGLRDRRLAAVVRRCRDLPGQELFQYVGEDGEPHDVASDDVNEYLAAVAPASPRRTSGHGPAPSSPTARCAPSARARPTARSSATSPPRSGRLPTGWATRPPWPARRTSTPRSSTRTSTAGSGRPSSKPPRIPTRHPARPIRTRSGPSLRSSGRGCARTRAGGVARPSSGAVRRAAGAPDSIPGGARSGPMRDHVSSSAHSWAGALVDRQREAGFEPAVRPIPAPDPAAHRLDEMATDERTDPGAGKPTDGRGGRQLEGSVQLVPSETRSAVEHGDRDPPGIGVGSNVDDERPVGLRLGVPDRAHDQVAARLLDVGRVTMDGRHVGLALTLDRDGPEPIDDLPDRAVDRTLDKDRLVERIEDPTLEPRQHQQVLDQVIEPCSLSADIAGQRLGGGSGEAGPAGEDRRAGVDRRDRRPQLMRQHLEECLADGSQWQVVRRGFSIEHQALIVTGPD